MKIFQAIVGICICFRCIDAFVLNAGSRSSVVKYNGIRSAKILQPTIVSSFEISSLAVGAPASIAKEVAIKSSLFYTAATKAMTPFRAVILLFAGIVFKLRNKIRRGVKDMEDGWTKRGSGGSFSRTVEVWTFAVSFIFKYFKVRKLEKGDPEVFSAAQTELARTLTLKLLELGPTFIKLGQLLSTRIDVLPREYINELSLLQDKVPGFPSDIAVSIIERELGQPIDQLYDTFEREPLAAASLGQVHRATKDGKELAVKIQRQGLKKLFDMDLKNIKVLAKILDALDPKTDGAQRDWLSIYDESAKLLYREIDYNLEAQNCIRFKENFANVPWVKVPEVYTNMTTTNMVTMEYVPGVKINDISKIEEQGIDRELLSKRSAESYLTQICRHGFFHCDPHPGNLACDAEEGGRLIYYDFGMMDELKPPVRKGLVDLIFSIYENDAKGACDALEDIECLKRGVDRVSVEKIARVFLGEFSQGIKPGEKWTSQLSKEEQKELRRQRRIQLGQDLFSVGSDVPFKFPPTFTFVFRAFTSLDGIGKGLDAKYDITRLAQPFLKELIDLRDGSATISLLKSWGKALGWRPMDISQAIQLPRKMANVDDVVTRMEQGDLKVRVRVLESEKAFQKMEITQANMATAIAASTCLNVGIMLSAMSSTPGQIGVAARLAFALSGVFGIQVPVGMLKLKALEKKFAPASA
mmetsp:Transcript_17062/g.28628  ORF Transcript_17062/g.28628 Transcript_17062/m.28628 type:complete len:697 (+) Transcript_17062:147-2237(+)